MNYLHHEYLALQRYYRRHRSSTTCHPIDKRWHAQESKDLFRLLNHSPRPSEDEWEQMEDKYASNEFSFLKDD